MSVAEPEALPLPLTTAAAAAPALRLLPAPQCEPPYDDELPDGARLRLVRTAPVPAVPSRDARPLRLVPDAEEAPDDADRTPLAALPPARPFAQALVQRLIEVLAGLRPLGQLQRDTTLELYDELARSVTARPRPAGPRPTRRDVRSVHVQARPDGVAEVCATVRRGGRVTALALRLEGRSGAWRCTDLVGL